MTMARSKQLRRGPQEKEWRYFDEKLNLNETPEQQLQQTCMQWQLLKNQCHTAACEGDSGGKVQYNQYCEVHGRLEKPVDHRDEEAQGDGEMVPQAKPVDGCVNHLLILAQSAEIVARSEDDHNKDSRENSQRSGFCHEVSMPRLTEIRKQARHKYLLLDQKRIEDSQRKDVDGKPVRLNQIKHQARCKSKNEGHKDENLQAKLIRLTQMKHLARLKGKSTVKERTGHEDCNQFEENKKEKAIAMQFEQDTCQEEGNLIEIASGKDQKMAHFKNSSLPVLETVPARVLFMGANQPYVENSERQNEFNCLKGRMRLTQLRREVRLRNQCYVGQGSTET